MPTLETTTPAALPTLPLLRAFILAGRAVFTVRSRRTGERRTFKVAQKEGAEGFYFVSLLNGPDNTSDYRYLGAMFTGRENGKLGWKLNRQGWAPEAGAAFGWVVKVLNGQTDASQAEFWHEGRCGRCGRALTTPESIASGIGPVCAGLE
jgi:hypothetical protein